MLNLRNRHKAIRKLIHRLPLKDRLRMIFIAQNEYQEKGIISFPKGYVESIFRQNYVKEEQNENN